MKHSNGIQLWNGLTYNEFGGEAGSGSQLQPFGAAVCGADLPTQLFIRHRRETETTTQGQSRSEAAKFLRDWADAIEGSEEAETG